MIDRNARDATARALNITLELVVAVIETYALYAPRESPSDPQPLGARHTDPDTSKRAALEHAPKAGGQRALALEIIAHAWGLAAFEIEQRTGVRGIWKRLSELEAGGWVFTSGERLCPATEKAQQVYYATAKGRDWAGMA